MAVKISLSIQFQEFRTNRSPNDHRNRSRYMAGDLLSSRRRVQHHAGEWVTGVPQQGRGKGRVAASTDGQQTPSWQFPTIRFVSGGVRLRRNFHEMFGREIDLVPIE